MEREWNEFESWFHSAPNFDILFIGGDYNAELHDAAAHAARRNPRGQDPARHGALTCAWTHGRGSERSALRRQGTRSPLEWAGGPRSAAAV